MTWELERVKLTGMTINYFNRVPYVWIRHDPEATPTGYYATYSQRRWLKRTNHRGSIFRTDPAYPFPFDFTRPPMWNVLTFRNIVAFFDYTPQDTFYFTFKYAIEGTPQHSIAPLIRHRAFQMPNMFNDHLIDLATQPRYNVTAAYPNMVAQIFEADYPGWYNIIALNLWFNMHDADLGYVAIHEAGGVFSPPRAPFATKRPLLSVTAALYPAYVYLREPVHLRSGFYYALVVSLPADWLNANYWLRHRTGITNPIWLSTDAGKTWWPDFSPGGPMGFALGYARPLGWSKWHR